MASEGGSDGARLAGSCLLASGLVFVLLNSIAEGLYPGYSVASNALSDLGALGAPTQLFWDGQLFVVGALYLVGVYSLFYRSAWGAGTSRRNLVAVLYLLPGIGTVVVSLFPENFVLAIHAVGALLAFIFGGIGAIYAYRLTQPPFRYFSVVLGIVDLVSIPLMFAIGPSMSGLAERLIVYPYVLWLACFGSYLLAARNHQ